MPNFRSFSDFAAALDATADDLSRAGKRKIVHEMAERAQSIAEAAASADLGGDPKFSGWAAPLVTQIKEQDGTAVVLPTRYSAGSWTVAEAGRNTGKAAKSGKRWNGVTRGKSTATKAVRRMLEDLPKMAEDGVRVVVSHRLDVDG